MEGVPVAQLICSFACSQIFTVVYGLYYFDAIGTTTKDCYYLEGSKIPMTKASADKLAKTKPYVTNHVKPVNVTENFDFILMLGWWACVTFWAVPIGAIVLRGIPTLSKVIAGLGSCAAMIMGLMIFVCVFMYRGSEGGAVCAGSYIK